jgi:hypothetical protein
VSPSRAGNAFDGVKVKTCGEENRLCHLEPCVLLYSQRTLPVCISYGGFLEWGEHMYVSPDP